MADKRISQLVERVNIANNDVLPIVASGATTTNKVTVSTLQDWMQSNLDVGVTSVGLSMPSAFVVSNSPVTGSGNISVTGAGTVSQYIRGDGSLADFPSGGGGGGSSVNYYLNGSVSQGTIGGIAYQEMNRTPILGAGTDFTIAADGYIASFITDAGDPALLEIPAGNWNFETYLQASSGGGTPSFYIELYKVDSGGTATLIASNSGSPELIAFGTTTTPYFSALAVPTTSLALTDRLALRYYVTHSGRTITLHTENATLCQIITTFTTGLTALNGLTAQVQNFATGTSGTDFAISSSVNTHTFNLPNASASARGVVSTGSQTFAGAKTFNSDIIVNGITVGKGIGANNGNNTAIGLNCLSSNTTGTLNTATGLSALQYNTAGNSNTANGANSLLANTTGGFNTASGNQSLYSNTTGQANTAIGINSLYSNTTGTYNIGVGSGAGYYIADGSTPNTTSDFSIYLGADTKASVDNAQNEVVIGYNAIGSGSNTVTIGNSSVTDNYFTGTIRSTALRLAAAGTADTTIFRNTSGTSSSTGSANVVGFNGSNNIFVTTNSKGGFLLDFNNSVSNRTYTLQDASGTLAFTSQIPSVVGVYLPLAGGTLTGALNGTSATFSTEVTSSGGQGRFGGWATGAGYQGNALEVGVSGGNAFMIGYNRTSGSYIPLSIGGTTNQTTTIGGSSIVFQNNGVTALTIASTGAATFSSSVADYGATITNIQDSSQGLLIRATDNDSSLYLLNLQSSNTTTGQTWVDRFTVAKNGAATFSSSVTATGLIINNNGEALRAYGVSPNVSFYNSANTVRGGYVNHDGSNMNIVANVGGISLTGAATFSSSVNATNSLLNSTSTQLILQNTDGGTNAERVGMFMTGADIFKIVSLNDNNTTRVDNLITANVINGNVGIGTSSPAEPLTIARSAGTACYTSMTTGSSTILVGVDAGGLPRLFTAGATDISFWTNSTERMRITSGGQQVMDSDLTSANIVVWRNSSASNPFGLNLTYTGSSPNGTSNNFLYCSDATVPRFVARSNGGLANYSGNDVNLSDERVKKDIEPLESYWDKFKEIEIVKFKYKDQTHDDFNIGVIAQQVEGIAPEFVDVDGWDTNPKLDEEGNEIISEEEPLKSIYTADLYHATIKVLQEAMAKIEKLETEIDSLKNQMQ